MNQINPLHIGAILILILIFVLFSLDSSKNELLEAKTNFTKTKELAVELKEYKHIYSNGSVTTKSLNRILKLTALKSANIEIEKSNSGMKLFSKSMDKVALNSLMGKLLNGSYNIEILRIKKLNNEKVSLHVGIKW